MNRGGSKAGKGSGGSVAGIAKKVAPPILPGSAADSIYSGQQPSSDHVAASNCNVLYGGTRRVNGSDSLYMGYDETYAAYGGNKGNSSGSGYADCTSRGEYSLDKSFDSSQSEVIYSSCGPEAGYLPSSAYLAPEVVGYIPDHAHHNEEPIYRRVTPKSLRTFAGSESSSVSSSSSSSATGSGAGLAPSRRPTEFKEPFPPAVVPRCSSSGNVGSGTPSPNCSTPPSLTSDQQVSPTVICSTVAMSAVPRGSRNSVSSGDSGWASAPSHCLSSFGVGGAGGSSGHGLGGGGCSSRASNSSLNSDKTSNSVEESYHHRNQVKQQRRLSSISSTGSIGLNSSFAYGTASTTFPNALNNRQDPSRQSLRTFGSSESVGSQGSKRTSCYSRASSVASSSSSSLTASSKASAGSLYRTQEGVNSLDYALMIEQGVSWEEIINCWLSQLRFSEYYTLFVTAGYDIQTISRMTPEDFTAIGIKKPNHRKKLKAAAEELSVGDGLPEHVPDTVHQFLQLLRLQEYLPTLQDQGYRHVPDLLNISIEDLEDIGFFRLGHQKRLLLGIKKVKELKKLGLVPTKPPTPLVNFPLHDSGPCPPGVGISYNTSGMQQRQSVQMAPKGGANAPSDFHYYPEEMAFQSLPPLPHQNNHHRFSSFHQESSLDHILEIGGGVGGMEAMPHPMPPIQHSSYPSPHPQRFERSVSEDTRPSVWQRFRSFDDTDIATATRRSSTGNNDLSNAGSSSGGLTQMLPPGRPPLAGTLPRPKATVKPLPAPTPCRKGPDVSGNDFAEKDHNAIITGGDVKQELGSALLNKGLNEVKRPDFSTTDDEGLSSDPDLLLPFANERAGTIKYKTNPSIVFQDFKDEEESTSPLHHHVQVHDAEYVHEATPPPPPPPASAVSCHRRQYLAATDNSLPSPDFPAPPSSADLNLMHRRNITQQSYNHTPQQQSHSQHHIQLSNAQQEQTHPLPSSTAINNSQPQQPSSSTTSSSSLLHTPTRAAGRSAGDVLQDIGTMLADLTDELDTMLQLEKS